MDLHFFNTLTHRIEAFVPSSKTVGFYCCGPTVYDFAHIGNFRTFVFADLLRRLLEFKGFKVNHVMNITDVDDKIIQRVNTSTPPTTLSDYTKKYEEAFFEDFRQLNCLEPVRTPHATEYIQQMYDLIAKKRDGMTLTKEEIEFIKGLRELEKIHQFIIEDPNRTIELISRKLNS